MCNANTPALGCQLWGLLQEKTLPAVAWRRVRVLAGGVAALAAWVCAGPGPRTAAEKERLLSWWDPSIVAAAAAAKEAGTRASRGRARAA